jgi:hypothetical protein
MYSCAGCGEQQRDDPPPDQSPNLPPTDLTALTVNGWHSDPQANRMNYIFAPFDMENIPFAMRAERSQEVAQEIAETFFNKLPVRMHGDFQFWVLSPANPVILRGAEAFCSLRGNINGFDDEISRIPAVGALSNRTYVNMMNEVHDERCRSQATWGPGLGLADAQAVWRQTFNFRIEDFQNLGSENLADPEAVRRFFSTRFNPESYMRRVLGHHPEGRAYVHIDTRAVAGAIAEGGRAIAWQDLSVFIHEMGHTLGLWDEYSQRGADSPEWARFFQTLNGDIDLLTAMGVDVDQMEDNFALPRGTIQRPRLSILADTIYSPAVINHFGHPPGFPHIATSAEIGMCYYNNLVELYPDLVGERRNDDFTHRGGLYFGADGPFVHFRPSSLMNRGRNEDTQFNNLQLMGMRWYIDTQLRPDSASGQSQPWERCF